MQLQSVTLHRVRRKRHHSRTTVIKYRHVYYCNLFLNYLFYVQIWGVIPLAARPGL